MDPTPETPLAEERDPRVSLRLRIWLACVAGGAIAGFGSLWVLGTRVQPGAVDAADLFTWLSGVAFAAVIAGLLLASWLDHHVVGHLRGVLRGMRSGRVAELRGLPGAAGWGELSDLSDEIQGLLAQQRRTVRSGSDLETHRVQLGALREAIERWIVSEHWHAPAIEPGAVAEVNDVLTRGLTRRATLDEQNREAVRQVAGELSEAMADAQESAEQAERGFVEATALLTSVRELQRLSGELQNALNAAGAPQAAAADDRQAPTREALEGLVAASQDSIEAIGRGMLRVQDVAEQVQQLANRATLIAIHVVTTSRREGAGDELANELKDLARDVRETTDRTTAFAAEIEAAVAEASERMRDARARALARLEAVAAAPPAPASARSLDDAQRLLERVREMVQDAARKGERLSAAGERASRAAERLARRVDEESSETQALLARLSPIEAVAPPARLELLDDTSGDDVEPDSGANDDTDASGEERK